nr:hypothetical protein CFP56_37354 [Quercus suber]
MVIRGPASRLQQDQHRVQSSIQYDQQDFIAIRTAYYGLISILGLWTDHHSSRPWTLEFPLCSCQSLKEPELFALHHAAAIIFDREFNSPPSWPASEEPTVPTGIAILIRGVLGGCDVCLAAMHGVPNYTS